jgi:phosphoenolpyruvate-protein phosphotransferase
VITLDGVALSPGVASGAAMTVRPMPVDEPSSARDGRTEQERFRTACRDAEAELRRTLEALPEADAAARQILRAHLALVADPMLAAQVESSLARDEVSAHAALERAAAALSSRFEALADTVMRQRAADLRDVCKCISRHLTGRPSVGSAASERRIVCAADLSPAQVIQLAQDQPLAFVIEQGADTSHAVILMRALAVPAVIVPGATSLVRDGDLVLVDGDRGQVLVHPDSNVSLRAAAVLPAGSSDSDPQPASTSDGVTIAVTATIADAMDARRAVAAGADGIGLFRTEMLFLHGAQLPSEEEQEACYSEVGRVIGARPLTVRILDLGADKQSPALRLPHEPNPALGVRGVRLLFARPALFMGQLRALLRAAVGRQVRLLVPMIIDTSDLARVRDLAREVLSSMASPLTIEIGVMIETPAAALMADELAAAADFLSIGTNDLAQYVLAADRHSPAMAAFYQPLHPAVLRLVRDVVAAAIRRQRAVSVCGEAAAEPRAVPLFLGMGVTELSVRPPAVTRVKSQVRRIDAAAARALAEEVAALPTACDVAARIDAACEMESGIDVRQVRDAR